MGVGSVGGPRRAVGKPRRKSPPPWGRILGGKPIERHVWNFEEKIDLGPEHVQQMQFLRMVRLKTKHYGITGGDDVYPIKGLRSADWLPWYELALALACEHDDSLTIADAPRPGKTARRWRGGLEGLVLLDLVDSWRKAYPRRPTRWCLAQIQKRSPNYAKMSLKTLTVRYHEAKRHRDTTKQMGI